MKNLKNLAVALSLLGAATVSTAGEINNWVNSSGEVWKNTPGECWRNSSWTPATAAPGCDGAIVEEPKAAPAPAPRASTGTSPQS